MFTSGIQDDNMKISSINGKRSSEYHQFFFVVFDTQMTGMLAYDTLRDVGCPM